MCDNNKECVIIRVMSCGKPAMQCSSFVGQFGVSPHDTMGTFGEGLSPTDSSGRSRCMNPNCSRPLVSKNYACKRCGGSQHIINGSQGTNDDNHGVGSEITVSIARRVLEGVRSSSGIITPENVEEANRSIHESMKVNDPTEVMFTRLEEEEDDNARIPDSVGNMISDKVMPKKWKIVAVDLTFESRSYYMDWGDGIEDSQGRQMTGEIWINENDWDDPFLRRKEMAHEFGHHLEEKEEANMRVAIAYWKSRTEGRDFQPISSMLEKTSIEDIDISSISEDEIGKEGGFTDPYTGKVYINDDNEIEGTEIISVGMEKILINPIGFYEEDPDHFEFMVRFLRGDFH